MGFGFFSEENNTSRDSHPITTTTIDLLFKTEIHDPMYKLKKRQLLNLIKQWKLNGTTIPLFYHPELHLIIVRLDETVSPEKSKAFFQTVSTLDYEFEVYVKTKEVLDVEF